ncbi:unnamed protein product [Amoebophrya sp. A120]|nr:unnamed protein product [Amoebophrya sp. A120]|eukprot:GSA120T00001387001.1
MIAGSEVFEAQLQGEDDCVTDMVFNYYGDQMVYATIRGTLSFWTKKQATSASSTTPSRTSHPSQEPMDNTTALFEEQDFLSGTTSTTENTTTAAASSRMMMFGKNNKPRFESSATDHEPPKSLWQECSSIVNAHEGPIWRIDWVHPEYGSNMIITCGGLERNIKVWEEQQDDSTNEKVLWRKIYETPGPIAKSGLGVDGDQFLDYDPAEQVSDVKFAPHHFGLKFAAASWNGAVTIYCLASEEVKPQQSLLVGRGAPAVLSAAEREPKVKIYWMEFEEFHAEGELRDGDEAGAPGGISSTSGDCPGNENVPKNDEEQQDAVVSSSRQQGQQHLSGSLMAIRRNAAKTTNRYATLTPKNEAPPKKNAGTIALAWCPYRHQEYIASVNVDGHFYIHGRPPTSDDDRTPFGFPEDSRFLAHKRRTWIQLHRERQDEEIKPKNTDVKDVAFAPNLCRPFELLVTCGTNFSAKLWRFDIAPVRVPCRIPVPTVPRDAPSSSAGGRPDSGFNSSCNPSPTNTTEDRDRFADYYEFDTKLSLLKVLSTERDIVTNPSRNLFGLPDPYLDDTTIWRCSWNVSGTAFTLAPGSGRLQVWQLRHVPGGFEKTWVQSHTVDHTDNYISMKQVEDEDRGPIDKAELRNRTNSDTATRGHATSSSGMETRTALIPEDTSIAVAGSATGIIHQGLTLRKSHNLAPDERRAPASGGA